MPAVEDLWPPYAPTTAEPWNSRRVVHLHRRAGFAATWAEIERDVSGPPQEAVTRLFEGRTRIDGQPADYESMAGMLTDTAVGSQMDTRLKAAWVYRLLFSPDPLVERLTLVWHNHFATSNRKVQNLPQMREQNDLLRKYARAPFPQLLTAVVHSPAMLVWLDADKNVAEHPNENLARELMELFTLGIGHYSEPDIREAARALTGWKVVSDNFRFDPKRHDAGEKSILGRAKNFDGDDLLELLCQQPATARRVAWRIARTFLADGVADDAARDALATGLREQQLNIGWAVQTVLGSRQFFSEANLGRRVAAPPEYTIGAVRALECFSPPPSTLLLADWMARMGQELYYPPNVGGWPEGRAWLASGAIVARANFATALLAGGLGSASTAIDALLARHKIGSNLEASVDWLAQLLFGGLRQEAVRAVATEAARNADRIGGAHVAAVNILLARPEAELN
jgi:uncharacterized protein (DUF1800 family)